MTNEITGLRGRRGRVWKAMAGALMIAAPLTAVTAGVSSASTHAPQAKAEATTKAAAVCGSSVKVGPSNPNGVYKTLPASLQSIYSSFPGKLEPSLWATTKIKAKPPWKIGLVVFTSSSPYNVHLVTGVEQQFAAAKKEGLVTGSLYLSDPANTASSTPEEQISSIQQMVREGVNTIIVNPVDSVAETPAMNAAVKAGVPIVLADVPPAPASSSGVIAAWSQNQVNADAGALGIIKSGNLLIVKGIPGNENDVVLYNQKIADLKDCPNIHVAATLYGQWDEGTTKTVVSEYLASHPGEKISGVLQDGGMTSGVIEAFEAAGKTVPTVSEGECYGGDLSWWLAHKSTFKTVGGCFNGFQGAYTIFNVVLRILDNKGPKLNVISMPTPAITNANLATFAQKGLPLTSSAEVGGPVTAWCSNTCLNKYFNVSGPVTK